MLRRRSLMGGGPKDYIEFVDAGIGAYFAERYGDGTGITYGQAAAITELDSDLRIADVAENKPCTFDEINYFTGLVSLPAQLCYGYSNSSTKKVTIQSLALPNLVSIGGSCFMYSTLVELVDCPKLETIGGSALSVSHTKRIRLGDAYTIGQKNPFAWFEDLEYLYFSNLQKIMNRDFIYTVKNTMQKIYIASASIPTIDSSVKDYEYDYIFNTANGCALYVPSNLVSAYSAAGSPWSVFASINAI